MADLVGRKLLSVSDYADGGRLAPAIRTPAR